MTSGNCRALENRFKLNLPKHSGVDQVVELWQQNESHMGVGVRCKYDMHCHNTIICMGVGAYYIA